MAQENFFEESENELFSPNLMALVNYIQMGIPTLCIVLFSKFLECTLSTTIEE